MKAFGSHGGSELTRRALVAVMLAAPLAAAAASLDFDKTFNDKSEPRQAHLVATYRLGGQEHRLEVWRDQELRLRRRTDDAIETYVDRPAHELEWKMVVLDLKRKVRTDIDRTNLTRIGRFGDWFGLSHLLARPMGSYQLEALAGPAPDDSPVVPCRWYLLTQGERSSNVCWSAKWRVPVMIASAGKGVEWRLTKIDAGPVADDIFRIDDRGFIRNDANEDIKPD